MQLKIKIEMNGAAFGEDQNSRAEEANRILKELAPRLASNGLAIGDCLPLRDLNGNKCGLAKVVA